PSRGPSRPSPAARKTEPPQLGVGPNQPGWMFEIPGHGFLQPTGQGATHRPVKLTFGLGGIDRIAEVMTRSVINEADLTRVAPALRPRFKVIKNAAQHLDQRNVVHVGAGAEQIFFAGLSA